MIKKKNKYYNRSHISEGKFRHLLRCFTMDLNAYEAHQISHISHRSCKVIYAKLRLYIVKRCVGNRASTGTFELDESYFGARPCSWKKRARSSRKDTCIWTFKTRRQVYVEIVENYSRNSLLPMNKEKF